MSFASIQSMKGILSSARYNDIMELVRNTPDQLKSANLIDSWLTSMEKADSENALPALRSLIKSRQVPEKAASQGKGNETRLEKAAGWMKAVTDAMAGLNLTEKARGHLLVAGAHRQWESSKYASIIKQCPGLCGTGDATMARMAEWFYFFSIKWEKPLDETDIAKPNDVRVPLNPGSKWVNFYSNRMTHITGGHTFRYYVFDQAEIENLERAINGVQTFWPVDHGVAEIAADVTSALLSAPQVATMLRDETTGALDVATPYHIRLVLGRSGNGVYRINTAFPGAIAQPNTHRIPQPFLKHVYDLMAPKLGMVSVKNAKKGLTEFDKAMAASASKTT